MAEGIPVAHAIFSFLFGFAILAFVLELIRRNHLQERYAVLWIVLTLVFMTYQWWLAPVAVFAKWADIGDVVTVVLFLGIFMCALLILQLSVKISEFSDKIKNLVQEVSILKHELARHGEEAPGAGGDENVRCKGA